MGRKDREITISGLTASSDLDALTAVFARFGACKKAFFLQGSTVWHGVYRDARSYF